MVSVSDDVHRISLTNAARSPPLPCEDNQIQPKCNVSRGPEEGPRTRAQAWHLRGTCGEHAGHTDGAIEGSQM